MRDSVTVKLVILNQGRTAPQKQRDAIDKGFVTLRKSQMDLVGDANEGWDIANV